MQKFIGVKLVLAVLMTRAAWCESRGWDLPENENGDDEGYEVEYLDGGKPNIEGREGYVSWCPKEQFENANRPTDGMSFGLALEAMKKGLRVARFGWDDGGDSFFLEKLETVARISMFRFGETVTWAPNNHDLLADDWVIVE